MHAAEVKLSDYVTRQIKGAEAQYRGSVITLVTPAGEYVYVSGRVFANSIDLKQLIGRSVREYLHPDDLVRVERAMQEAFVCDQPVQVRVRVRTRDGYGRVDRISRRLICEQTGNLYILSIATKIV